MSTNDDDQIIDAEIVEDHNLPAIVDQSTHDAPRPIEAARSQTADGRDWPHGPKPERRCTAHSSRTGDPCKNAAIKGGNVCRYHGGAAKQIKQAARTRLENAADLMAKQLLGIALTGDTDTVKLAAIRDALDRAGLKAPSEVVLSQGEPAKYEMVFDSIGGTPGDEFPSVPSGYDSAGNIAPETSTVSSSFARSAEPNPSPTQPDAGDSAGTREYGDSLQSAEGRQSSRDESLRQGPRRESGRETRRQPPTRHITGEAAMRAANAANLAAGVFDEQLALESNHRRYPRP